jgi:hypothetical protein
VFPKMFPIASHLYPISFDQSWTFIYINYKGAKGKHASIGVGQHFKNNCDETITWLLKSN